MPPPLAARVLSPGTPSSPPPVLLLTSPRLHPISSPLLRPTKRSSTTRPTAKPQTHHAIQPHPRHPPPRRAGPLSPSTLKPRQKRIPPQTHDPSRARPSDHTAHRSRPLKAPRAAPDKATNENPPPRPPPPPTTVASAPSIGRAFVPAVRHPPPFRRRAPKRRRRARSTRSARTAVTVSPPPGRGGPLISGCNGGRARISRLAAAVGPPGSQALQARGHRWHGLGWCQERCGHWWELVLGPGT